LNVFLHLWNVVATGLWMYFLFRRLRYLADKQQPGILAQFFFAGALSIVVTIILHGVYPLPFLVPFIYDSEFFYQVLVTGVIEEFAKFVCFLSVAHTLRTVREPQDGVIQAAVVGLVFGAIENVTYIERYRSLYMAIRPVLTTGGHMVYAAIWGGLYSQALYSNLQSRDPESYRSAYKGVALVALIHGIYNTSVGTLGLMAGLAVDAVALTISAKIFLQLVDQSPYRVFPLSMAKKAIPLIRRGLYFNPKSTILNRNMGLYRMYLGEYPQAASNFVQSMKRAYDPRRAQFFTAVCELNHIPRPHAERRMRTAWARLTDDQREKLLGQLSELLANDSELLEKVYDFVNRAFKLRGHRPAHEIARELRRKRAEQKAGRGRSPVYDELVSRLSAKERREMAGRINLRRTNQL
jgi:RsiW-degrading membrane proteinase PrsW (M82 family)